MAYPIVKISNVHNAFIRLMHFEKAGDQETSHKHQFDHITLLSSGALRVTTAGKDTVFRAPHLIFIKKDTVHELFALEDNTVACCIHLTNEGETIISSDMVPNGVELAA